MLHVRICAGAARKGGPYRDRRRWHAQDDVTAAREFRVELQPAGTVKTVTYSGRQIEVTY